MFDTWEETLRVTEGFSGAVFRRFDNKESAEWFARHGRVRDCSHVMVQVFPSRHQVVIWTKAFVEPKSAVHKILTYDESEACTPAYAELLGVRCILREWKMREVDPDHIRRIDVTEQHAAHTLRKYLPGWAARHWKTSRGKPLPHDGMLSEIWNLLTHEISGKVSFFRAFKTNYPT